MKRRPRLTISAMSGTEKPFPRDVANECSCTHLVDGLWTLLDIADPVTAQGRRAVAPVRLLK